MKLLNDCTPNAQEAFRKLRALHRLPQTEGALIAEKKILNRLNSNEILDVALLLEAQEKAQ